MEEDPCEKCKYYMNAGDMYPCDICCHNGNIGDMFEKASGY